jgi:hypothetical protein
MIWPLLRSLLGEADLLGILLPRLLLALQSSRSLDLVGAHVEAVSRGRIWAGT